MAAQAGLGARLRSLRHARGLTQDELAFRSGVPQATISTLESGKVNRTSHGNMEKLAGALGVTNRDLYEAAGLIEAAPASPIQASPEVPERGMPLDTQAKIAYVESRPGTHFQAQLAVLRDDLTRQQYEDLLVRIFAAWEANSELALGAYAVGR